MSGFFLTTLISCDNSPAGPPGFSEPSTPPVTGGPSCKSLQSYGSVKALHEAAFAIKRDSERFQHTLEEHIDGFGGLFMDESGNYVAYLKRGTDESLVRDAINVKSAKKSNSSFTYQRDLSIREAQFTFSELAAWRELATAFLLAGEQFSYVSSTQVHEAENRVAIGIDAAYWVDENKEAVQDFLANFLEIPVGAILFEREYPETEEEDDDIFATLGGDTFDRQRPILGGLRIRYDSSNCSMGFLGMYDGTEVFVTNGHCTENAHGRSTTLYFQGERDEPNDVVGTEIADGPQSLDMCVSMNSDCWPCRWSDSAIVSIDEDVDRAIGYIAKTEWKSEAWMVEGSREIDTDKSPFAVVDLIEDIMTGMTLHKIGGNSGWTSGEVIRTCVDSRRSRHELILQCQYRARYATSGGGTSGSPVFKRVESDDSEIENPVVLVGIHRASSNRDQPNGYSAFSPIDGVLKDFEKLNGLTIDIDNN
ncbi:MAG: hypothetical protein EA391_10175 [Balneolaceae bacterium]|nr:MAG: hypothetical protein EA391_10175 [Balneolaceae bacterium]